MQGTYHSYLDWNTRLVALLGDANAEVATVPEPMNADAPLRQVTGLAPLTRYTVRVHTPPGVVSPMVWSPAGIEPDLCTKEGIVGAHRPGNSPTGADAFVDLDLTSDAAGRIALVGTNLDDDEVISVGRVEVFDRPKTVAAVGVTTSVTSDRPQRASNAGIVGRDRLVVDIGGLKQGRTYSITVHTTATRECDQAGSRWTVDEVGYAPRVVSSFALAGSTFTFQHVASSDTVRLHAADVLYRLSTNPSEIGLGSIEIDEVVP